MIRESKLKKELKSFGLSLLVVMVIRTFLFQPFNIPSGSMIPTLLIGDYLVVSKFSYGYSRYSLPFAPKLFQGRYMSSAPKQGDVVVFTTPKDKWPVGDDHLLGLSGDADYIKRLIGLPGDKVQVIKGILHINEKPATLERTKDYHTVDNSGRVLVMPQYWETLPNGVRHLILKSAPFGEGSLDDTPVFTVPEDHYFFMGDNRDNSKDSRVLEAVGYVEKDLLIGRAEALFFSTEAKWYEVWNWLFDIRYSRLFKLIK